MCRLKHYCMDARPKMLLVKCSMGSAIDTVKLDAGDKPDSQMSEQRPFGIPDKHLLVGQGAHFLRLAGFLLVAQDSSLSSSNSPSEE